MKIADRRIGPDEPVYIIAEAGLAHLGSLDLALQMLDYAVEAGADAFKTQYWLTDNWRPRERCLTRYSLEKLKAACDDAGITFLCTPHDWNALDTVVELGCPAIKIGSGAKGNKPLIRAACNVQLPLIVSTGGYEAPDWLFLRSSIESREWCRLECVSKYPTKWEDIHWDRNTFLGDNPCVGWSSHTANEWAIDEAAVAAGACIVEKHIKPGLWQEPETSMDMKAATECGIFGEFCDRIRRVDAVFERTEP